MGAVVLLSAALAGCPGSSAGGGGLGGLGGGGGGGGELGAQCTGDFGAEASAQKLEAFLLATASFVGTAAELEATLASSCREMGEKLGIPEAEMQGDPPQRAACNAVAAKIQSELRDLRAAGQITVTIAAVPPRCEVSMDAYANCAAECDARYEPGSVEVECTGGEIVGTCSGSCQGSCVVEASGRCEGSCQGSCEGGCTGTCQGGCDGTCSATGADGQCNGRCDGTCTGTCSAGCQGSCEGECHMQAQASCQGECHGGCSVEMTEPRCTGEVRPPELEAECSASCDARLNAEARCEPGRAEVVITGNLDSNLQARAEALKEAISVGWGTILAVKTKLERLAASGQAMVRTAEEVPGAVGSLGLQAGACATQAAAMIPRATASISVSVEVSASVSGSAGAG